jgi:tetratricopeptide (TPR) repeat protein
MEELLKDLKVPMDQPLELVVLAVKKSAIRCKIVASGAPITFRKVRNEVEGEIITVKPSKLWRYKKTHYMTGEIDSRRIDIEALGLKALSLKNMNVWSWNPKDEYWGEVVGEAKESLNKYLKPIIDYGPRLSYEMEQVLPLLEPENPDSDPIFEASEYYGSGDYQKALKIIEEILATDLRCLDAHAHLGNWEFNRTDEPHINTIDKAKRHYEVGVKIGGLSFDKGFNGVLPWGPVNNRPFLRCLYGYGLSLWRLGKSEEAREVFNRMLWLNPLDNQGIRFLLADIDSGKTWYELYKNSGND